MKTNENQIWQYEAGEVDKLAQKIEKDPGIAFTKRTMAQHLVSLVNFTRGDVVMEPCYGDGAFFDCLPENTTNLFCEINLGIDYLAQNKIVDITLSNPPFVPRKLFWQFHQKAMETTNREIWWLINISSLNVFTPNRIEEMNSKQWFLNRMHITSDKRWFGRYVWCQFIKEDRNFMTFNKKVF